MDIKSIMQRSIIFLFVIILFLYSVFSYYKLKREQEAQEFIYPSVVEFEKGNFYNALYGASTITHGFYSFMLKYYDTHAGNTSRIYAGVCFIKLGQYKLGIKCLLSAKVTDKIMESKVLSFLGDAYMDLKEYNSALEFYLKAASKYDNDVDTPLFLFRAVFAYEMLEQYDKALALLEDILSKYKKSEKYSEFLAEKTALDFVVKKKKE